MKIKKKNKMLKSKKEKGEKMKKTNIIIVVAFLLFALLIGSNHEPWVDEAQSWIIARDASAFEIVWNIARYEGSFPLWHLTLKLFIVFGLKYEYLFIVPIIISAIGLVVFLKKVQAPKFVKILLPFTYYVFYQYTIIARSYCYLLLAFSLLAVTYKNRLQKPLNYVLALVFMSLISMHGMVISVILAITLFIEILKQKNIRKYIKEFIIFGTIIIVECIILFPRSDLYMTVSAVYTIPQIMQSIFYTIIGNGNIISKIYNIVSVIIFLLLFINLIKIKNKDMFITALILFGFMFIIRLASHHCGILFLLVIFGIICNYDEIKEKNKNIDKILIVFLITYSIASINPSINDYKYEYSGAKAMAEYIEEKGYNNQEIFGFGYKTVSVQAYFDENLYDNREETIYRWTIDNKDFYNYCNFITIDKSKFKDVPKFILIENDTNNDVKLEMIKQTIEETGRYEIEYQTLGKVFFKNSYSENEGYTLYKLKE